MGNPVFQYMLGVTVTLIVALALCCLCMACLGCAVNATVAAIDGLGAQTPEARLADGTTVAGYDPQERGHIEEVD